ncbi:aminotransferase class I/II-fold pyridoxal phosphate-dependent enzyme [Agrobacterium vitis]|uniref:8-amino-7-oxononanoate synthase n=1 Tax=Agrobacterium vitis TaxID=373 RepID=UPI001326E2AE|nr:aminotransferase class I/II-fold pyridoxal phosphate-dependent enzyme [Agrobacterium vitis]
MKADRLGRYSATLGQLHRKDRLRALKRDSGVDFTSNDYLGLAASPDMQRAMIAAIERGVPAGAGGSRLLRGNHAEHEALEAEAATFFGCDRMLYFGSGYSANLAVLSTLPQRGDLIVFDCRVHASAHEGMKAGKAEMMAVAHNNPQAMEDAIRAWRAAGGMGCPWIVVESLYSMDGDRSAALSDLITIADRHNGFLFIDEAHATGVHGIGGIGFSAEFEGRDNVVVLHTCGKALGAAGALVGGNRVLCDFLVNRARPFIYSTAPSPLQAACVRYALGVLTNGPERRSRLYKLIDYANVEFSSRFGTPGSGTQILPVIIGDNGRAVRIADRMQTKGFDIRAIRAPTVPAGTARLRITITLNVDRPAVARMMDALAEAMEEEKA